MVQQAEEEEEEEEEEEHKEVMDNLSMRAVCVRASTEHTYN